jgi:hypothetical protein
MWMGCWDAAHEALEDTHTQGTHALHKYDVRWEEEEGYLRGGMRVEMYVESPFNSAVPTEVQLVQRYAIGPHACWVEASMPIAARVSHGSVTTSPLVTRRRAHSMFFSWEGE